MVADGGFSEWEMIVNKLTQLNWILISLFTINFMLCLKASPYLKIFLPITILLVALNNWVVSHFGTDYHETLTLTSTLLFSILCYGFFFTKGVEAINNPSIRWWLVPKRHLKNFPVWLESNKGNKILARVFDISKTGLFISSIEGNNWFTKYFSLGEVVSIKLATSSGLELRVDAEVVRKASQTRGNYPEGLGLQFKGLTFLEKLDLSRILLQEDYQLTY